MASTADWRVDLMKAHPRLFRILPEEPARSFGYPLCKAGWSDVLVRLCNRIENALRFDETFQFVRIKQKFGIARVDWDGEVSDETGLRISEAINLAIARSACICGTEGHLYSRRGWLTTRCAEHKAGDPVPLRTGFENVRILRRWPGRRDMYHAHYDRETDTLIEISPLSPPRRNSDGQISLPHLLQGSHVRIPAARHACPGTGIPDVQFAVGITELQDDDPLIQAMARLASKTARRTMTDKVLLWVLSDLHLELTRGWDLPSGDARPHFHILVIAGDLVPRAERGVAWLLERVPDRPVIYVAGNHEGYGCDIDRTVEKAKEAAAGTSIHVLQDESVQIGEITFAGATLWTDFNLFGDQWRAMRVAGDRMNDFRKIRTSRYANRFRPHHALARHIRSRAFLEAEMSKPRVGPLVVVTHHAPHPGHSFQHQSERLSDEEILAAAYRSDLTSVFWPAPIEGGRNAPRPADCWIFGHTHESEDVTIGHTRVVSNAKGYGPWAPQHRIWDNPKFDPNFVIEI